MSDTVSLSARISLQLDRFRLDVDLETHSHVTGLFGPSGCGKTSLLESIAGLRSDSRGRISLGHAQWQDTSLKILVPPEKRGIGYVPQSGLLFPHQSVRRNLEAGFRRAQREERDSRQIYDSAVELLELGPLLDRKPLNLSGGERQRVALGRALCSAPRLMLLDEPLAALDQPLRRKILPFLRRVRDEVDVPMILVSHDPLEVQALCDDLVVLDEGRVIARGAPGDVLTDPAVFPIAKERGFDNVIQATIVEREEWQTTVRLGETELTLVLPATLQGASAACLVGIPARDVLVAVEKPKGLSARNVFGAIVEELYTVETSHLLKARISADLPAITVEIGRAAVEELGLAKGRAVYLVIKAMSCSLYDEAG
jgi:molybdate transport system ATP-binding protein